MRTKQAEEENGTKTKSLAGSSDNLIIKNGPEIVRWEEEHSSKIFISSSSMQQT